MSLMITLTAISSMVPVMGNSLNYLISPGKLFVDQSIDHLFNRNAVLGCLDMSLTALFWQSLNLEYSHAIELPVAACLIHTAEYCTAGHGNPDGITK